MRLIQALFIMLQEALCAIYIGVWFIDMAFGHASFSANKLIASIGLIIAQILLRYAWRQQWDDGFSPEEYLDFSFCATKANADETSTITEANEKGRQK